MVAGKEHREKFWSFDREKTVGRMRDKNGFIMDDLDLDRRQLVISRLRDALGVRLEMIEQSM
jgi:hypothetical protein